jgi:hypothetical protein
MVSELSLSEPCIDCCSDKAHVHVAHGRKIVPNTTRLPGLLRARTILTGVSNHVRSVDILHRANRLVLILGWYLGRLKLITGIVTLGAATAILAVSGARRMANRNQDTSLRLLPLILAAVGFLLFTNRSDSTAAKERRAAIEKVRTG